MGSDHKPPLDVVKLLELYGDELLAALAREFVSSAPGMLNAVRTAVETGDTEALFQSAHRLKSAISNLYSEPASDAAARLERMGRFDQLDDVHEALAVLEAELARLVDAVKAVTASEPQPVE
jgi:HPt (histidine-containing phosphotransfer) domain-containing protein